MFLGLPDPDADPLVRGMDLDPALDPDPGPSFILLSTSKNSKKNLDDLVLRKPNQCGSMQILIGNTPPKIRS